MDGALAEPSQARDLARPTRIFGEAVYLAACAPIARLTATSIAFHRTLLRVRTRTHGRRCHGPGDDP
jgi:hypothetical protein